MTEPVEFPLYTDHNPGRLKQSDINSTLEADTYGASGSPLRGEWVELLSQANDLIADTWVSYESAPQALREEIYPKLDLFVEAGELDFGQSDLDNVQVHTVSSGYTGNYTDLNNATRESTKQFMWEIGGPVYRANWRGGTITTLTQIYNAFYFDNFNTPITYLPHGSGAEYRHKGISITMFTRAVFAVEQELLARKALLATLVESAQGSDVAQSVYESTGLVPTRLDSDDVNYLSGREDYQRYFSTIFNKEVIALIPIIENFYLTNKYFSNINKAMDNTKDRALDILLSTIRNDDNFDNTPDMTRASAAAAIANSTGQDQNEAFNSAARDFILKMLIKTPIDILKGVVELVDPHVALTKIIKVGTGKAFNDLAKELDAPARGINEELTGEDLLKLVLCFVDQSLSVADNDSNNQLPQVPAAGGENFFPRISIDGVDFTGTVSGMLMVPPSPLGLIYLLLELLKNEVTDAVENVDQAGTEAANETEC